MWKPSPATVDEPQTQPSQPQVSAPVAEERRRVAWIGASVVFKGELLSSEDLRIDGRIEGTIDVRNHDLIVGPSGQIVADIVAKTITVRGTVRGTLTASRRIEIRETAFIDGDITAPRLVIIEGATVQGHVHTEPTAVAAGDPVAVPLQAVGA
jgi:cytoskeletal protein CcmA (bactofilin family)